MNKFNLRNEILMSASALDPRAQSHEMPLQSLLKFPKLVTNVASQMDFSKYDREVRLY